MHKLRVLLLLLLLDYAVCDVAKSGAPKSAAPTAAVSSTILTKTRESQDTKSRTEKRDSSDQTASYAEKPKDEPFRPMYVVQHQQQQPQQYYQQEAAVGGGGGATRYVAAAAEEAAAAAATPQAYYDKSELTGGIHYAAAPAATAIATPAASHNAAHANTAGGILYASSAYRGPFNPAYQQQQQQQIPAAHAAAPQQVKTATTNVATAPQSPQTYAYAEPETNYIYERVPQYQHQQQQQQQQQQSPLPQQHHQQQHSQQHQPQHHNHHQQQQQQQRPLYHREPQQIQYVIAIPLSYMRQLQHQLSAMPAHASQAYAQQSPAPSSPQMLQVIGPLARDHQGMYRPYHYPATAGGAVTSPSAADTVTSAAHATYSNPFMQLPASVILAAAKSLYQQQQQQQQHQQQQQLYYTPQHILQPAYPQHYPQQLHHHQQQPVQQLAPFYAYPVQQQHQPQLQLQLQQQQQQKQQQQQLHTVVRIGGVKPNPSAKLSQHQHQQHPQAAPPQPVVAVPSHQPLTPPLLHYNHIYVQQPPPSHTETQALPGGAFSFARYSQSLLHEGAAAPQHFVRLSAPNALVAPQPHYSTLYSYEAEMGAPTYAHSGQEAPLSALPYFTHPGAVHYGSHLYHPPTPTSAKVAAAAQSVATPHAAGNQAQPRAAAVAASSVQHSASAVAAGDNTVVKYP